MSAFLSKLEMENADGKDDGEWLLVAPLVYQSDVASMTLTAPVGFSTDLASVPRLPVVFWLCGSTSNEAAVVHDYLYRSKILPRAKADAVLREASAVTGVAAWRRGLMWAGVRLFGWHAWRADSATPVTAPASPLK
jgi:hypothetical protein